ncbi:MAG: hypothetical protein RLZZ546_2843 [Bacteroidota bacterium]|jgi:cell division transport system permease protein
MRASAGKSSVFYAVLSNTIVLVLIGVFAILYLHTNSIMNVFKEKVNILVELNADTTSNGVKSLMTLIQANNKVSEQSVKFIPKSEADKILGINVSENVKDVGNPFKDIISFNVKAEHYSEENLAKIKSELKTKPIVYDVFYENVVIENIKTTLRSFSYIILLLSIIFIVLAIVIIYNTINLSLYADRWEIKTMEIIGARDSFIRQPYIKIGGNIALKSFAFASFILFGLMVWLGYQYDGFYELIKWYYVLLAIVLIFLISLIINITSTIIVVNKYLFKLENELY